MKHYNKREKVSSLLFKVVEYGLIAFGINALLPNSPNWGVDNYPGKGGIMNSLLFALILALIMGVGAVIYFYISERRTKPKHL